MNLKQTLTYGRLVHGVVLVCVLALAIVPDASADDETPDYASVDESYNLLLASASELDTVNEGSGWDSLIHVSPIVVTAERIPRRLLEIPAFVTAIVPCEYTAPPVSRNLPEALGSSPGIMVQKTSCGQGSPFMRGFTGFRTLLLVDGIRLNHAAFRDGPNQYWNTVDLMSVSRLEVVRGPGSVLYGSEAVGGTANAIITRPQMSYDGFGVGSQAFYRFASADESHIGRIDIDAGYTSEFGMHIGLTSRDFGDLRAGGDVGKQPKTGYDELAADIKAVWHLSDRLSLSAAHQNLEQDDVWRTHKTIYGKSWQGTTVGSDLRRSFDHKRRLSYVQSDWRPEASLLNRLKTTVSYHYQWEQRYRVKSDSTSERQGFDIGNVGIATEATIDVATGELLCGVEHYRESVESFKRKFSSDGTLKSIAVQGPIADEAEYISTGVFSQYSNEISERLRLVGGLRYSRVELGADRIDDPASDSVMATDQSWDNISGSLGMTYALKTRTRLFMNLASSFRAPNLSDLTRFDAARTNEFETPALDLAPEHYLTAEIGVKHTDHRWDVQWSAYHVWIDDLIIRTPTGRLIEDQAEVTKRNSDGGYVVGSDLSLECLVSNRLQLRFLAAVLYAGVDTYPTSTAAAVREPLDRLMPPTAQIGLRYSLVPNSLWLDAELAAAASADDLSTRDKADTQRIPPDGTPGYTLLDLSAAWRVTEQTSLKIELGNVFDEDYRTHGSGQNEPGRNLVLIVGTGF